MVLEYWMELTIEESDLEGSMKDQLDAEIEAGFGKLTSQSWKGDNMEIKPPEGKELFASLNVNGRALVDHDQVVKSHWSKWHELNISSAAIQDTRLNTPGEAENFIICKATGELKTKTVHVLDVKAKLQLRVHRRC